MSRAPVDASATQVVDKGRVEVESGVTQEAVEGGQVFVAPPPDSNVLAPKKGGLVYLGIKRIFDILFSLVVCILLLIPMVVICIAISLESSGSPFFRQERIGKNGRVIRIFKLRTMAADAHSHPERYLTPEQHAVWLREQKIDNDPRITGVGHILRKTSLDEVPQFLSVLKGDLSVIGPRPITLEETYEFGEAREEFLSCKPGITGWWQVTDRNDSTWKNGQRQLRELFYVRHASLVLDLRIFIKTFKVMFVEKTGR